LFREFVAQRCGALGRRRITIERNDGDVGRRLQQRTRVPTAAESAIEVAATGSRREELQHLAQQHGFVAGGHGSREGLIVRCRHA
jgi:hypothetical protein